VEARHLAADIEVPSAEDFTLEACHGLFCKLLLAFDAFWREQAPSSVMEQFAGLASFFVTRVLPALLQDVLSGAGNGELRPTRLSPAVSPARSRAPPPPPPSPGSVFDEAKFFVVPRHRNSLAAAAAAAAAADHSALTFTAEFSPSSAVIGTLSAGEVVEGLETRFHEGSADDDDGDDDDDDDDAQSQRRQRGRPLGGGVGVRLRVLRRQAERGSMGWCTLKAADGSSNLRVRPCLSPPANSKVLSRLLCSAQKGCLSLGGWWKSCGGCTCAGHWVKIDYQLTLAHLIAWPRCSGYRAQRCLLPSTPSLVGAGRAVAARCRCHRRE
jgi:hypothetical protein